MGNKRILNKKLPLSIYKKISYQNMREIRFKKNAQFYNYATILILLNSLSIIKQRIMYISLLNI
jgi:hypothetical protein